jgi:acyl carrier protein
VKPEEGVPKDFGLRREDFLALTPGERSFALERCIQGHVADVLQVPFRQIDTGEPLGSYGLESAKGTELIAALADSLGISLPATTIFNYPNIAELSRHIASLMEMRDNDHASGVPQQTPTMEDESILALLGAVERTSVSEMQEMIEEQRHLRLKNSGEKL